MIPQSFLSSQRQTFPTIKLSRQLNFFCSVEKRVGPFYLFVVVLLIELYSMLRGGVLVLETSRGGLWRRLSRKAIPAFDASEESPDWGVAASLPELVAARKCHREGLYSLAVPPLRRALDILQHVPDAAAATAAARANRMLLDCFHRQGRFSCVERLCRAKQPSLLPTDPFPDRTHVLLYALLRQHRWEESIELVDSSLASLASFSSHSLDSSAPTWADAMPLYLSCAISFPSGLSNPAQLLLTRATVMHQLGKPTIVLYAHFISSFHSSFFSFDF